MNLLFKNSKTTFVTVNQIWYDNGTSARRIQKQRLLLLIKSYVNCATFTTVTVNLLPTSVLLLILTNSKTTFVTVNRKYQEVLHKSIFNSKTTFVTVNHKLIN